MQVVPVVISKENADYNHSFITHKCHSTQADPSSANLLRSSLIITAHQHGLVNALDQLVGSLHSISVGILTFLMITNNR